MNAKDTLRRMLFLDSLLSLGGIVAATTLFLLGLEQQQAVTEQIYQHPFVVSNAALDLKMDVLALRNRMLELGMGARSVDDTRAEVVELRRRIREELGVVQRSFLGDMARVKRMSDLIEVWNLDQEASFSDLSAGRNGIAFDRIGHSAGQEVDELLSLCEYVISFARNKAAEMIVESQARYRQTQQMIVAGALLLGAVYLVILFKRGQAKRELFEELHNQANYDELTGAHNRRAFLNLASLEIERTSRLGGDLSLIAFDIDHFKRVNDEYGHASGDAVLRQFGVGCQDVLRKIDTFGRIGGEEFAVLLPGADVDEAARVAERIRAATERSVVRTPSQDLSVTVSAGIARLGDTSMTVEQLLSAADGALYEAKRSGRNRIVIAGPVQLQELAQPSASSSVA
jgi:diguanylate cyclase (GGDEF)-like protein